MDSFVSQAVSDGSFWSKVAVPPTQYEYTKSGFGAFSLFTDFKNTMTPANYKVSWPSILTGLIIAALVAILCIGLFMGIWVGDIVFPVTNPGVFTLETLAMSVGMALMMTVLFRYTRSTKDNRPPFIEQVTEVALLTAKFGLLHLLFQFTGFYSWAFPDSALGGILTTEWGTGNTWTTLGVGKGKDKVDAEKAAGIDTGKMSVFNHANPYGLEAKGHESMATRRVVIHT